jgi:hypothetical protein
MAIDLDPGDEASRERLRLAREMLAKEEAASGAPAAQD